MRFRLNSYSSFFLEIKERIMESMFELIEEEMTNKSTTENGAVGYKSSKSALLDLNYQVSSLRNSTESEIIDLFDKAFNENKEYAVKWLFYVRDIREGLGERRLFRICYGRLIDLDVTIFAQNLIHISEYGRWDDLISLIGVSNVTDEMIIRMIKTRLLKDMADKDCNKPISLLAKWLPSENASSRKTRKLAKTIIKLLNISPRRYRLLLSELRGYLDVVEVKMCDNRWDEINYNNVPSLANLKYRRAFMKHDLNRRQEYIDSVKKGKSKMNMSVATPVDVVSRYTIERDLADYDETLELAWSNLKDIQISNTLVVADGSGSMLDYVNHTTTALDVANALAIYASEHNSGVYKDKYITFSNTPQFVNLEKGKNLQEKINIALQHSEISNTNIEAVFNLILDIAIENNILQDEMIENILIISDMEFDAAQTQPWDHSNVLTKPLFKQIQKKYDNEGYKLPKLIFWNVNSRTKTIPIIENDLGVMLISGFSQNALKMIMSNKFDPYEVLIETITNERYDMIKI